MFFTTSTRRAGLAGKVNIMNKIRKAFRKKSGDSYVKATVVKQDDALYSEAIEYSPMLPQSYSPDHQNQSHFLTPLKHDNIERQTPRLEGLTAAEWLASADSTSNSVYKDPPIALLELEER